MLRKWFLFFVLFVGVANGSIIKKPPTKPVEIAYHELVCTEEDQANIHEIISAMGEKGKLGLLLNKAHLEELGAQINHVHPLKFLETVFANSYLKEFCMPVIWNDYFKKKNFLHGGLVESLDREGEKGRLEQYLPGFSFAVHVKVEDIKPFFDSRDWEGLILHLMQSQP